MRVDIKGNNPITSENVKCVIDDLNESYKDLGLKVKNLTMYVRFVNESGRIVEPVKNGVEVQQTYTFSDVIETTKKGAKKNASD